MAKVGKQPTVKQADLKAKQARIACIAYDNGRTPGSSTNAGGGAVDFIRFSWPMESKGVMLNGQLMGAGQLIGPTTGWTQQFTDSTGNNGKDGVDPSRWVPFFNQQIAASLKPEKTCAAYAVYPATTWRAVKITSVDPCFKVGTWKLCRTDNGVEYTVYPVLPEQQIVKVWCREIEDKDGLKIEFYNLNSETGEFEKTDWPTWQPYQGATPEPIPFDCFIDCDAKFEDFIEPDAVSDCNNYEVQQLCVFDEGNVAAGSEIETVAVFLWDCDGQRITEIYTWQRYLDSLLPGADPLDPTADQYTLPDGATIANCDGSAYEEPPVEEPECGTPTVELCLIDGCETALIASLGRPNNGVTWELQTASGQTVSGATYGEFSTAMQAAGYCEFIAGPTNESHRFCPFPEGGGTLTIDGESNPLQPVSFADEPENWPKPPQYGCVELTKEKNSQKILDQLEDNQLPTESCIKADGGLSDPVVHTISDNNTDIDYSYNTTTLKLNVQSPVNDPSAQGAVDAIHNCVANGGEAKITFRTPDGQQGFFTAASVIQGSAGAQGSHAFSGIGDVSQVQNGKIQRMEVVCCAAGQPKEIVATKGACDTEILKKLCEIANSVAPKTRVTVLTVCDTTGSADQNDWETIFVKYTDIPCQELLVEFFSDPELSTRYEVTGEIVDCDTGAPVTPPDPTKEETEVCNTVTNEAGETVNAFQQIVNSLQSICDKLDDFPVLVTKDICATLLGFDYDRGLLTAGDTTAFRILVDGAEQLTVVHDYTTTYDGSNVSTYYDPVISAINAIAGLSMTLVQDVAGTDQGKPQWRVEYTGECPKRIEIQKSSSVASLSGSDAYILDIDASGNLTTLVKDGGTEQPDFFTPVWGACE